MLEPNSQYEFQVALDLSWPGDVWTEAVSTTSGVFYRKLGLTPVTIAASGADHNTSATQRYGVWLQYRGGGINIEMLQDTPILGTGNPLQTFRRFGAFAANARSDVANRTLLGLTPIGTTGGQPNYNFTPAQIRDWRIAFRDASGAEYGMDLPSVSEDPTEPYIWDNGTALRTFLTNAHAEKNGVDMVVYDSTERQAPRHYRHWTGAGPLTFGGDTYTSGRILGIGDISFIGETDVEGTQVQLDIAELPTRERFLTIDPGPAPIVLYGLWRKDAGPWTAAWTYRGRLSESHYDNGVLEIAIQREFNKVWRGEIRRWTGSDQRRRHPDDSGLDRADRIRRTGLLLNFQA